jgi:hypothetical protein
MSYFELGMDAFIVGETGKVFSNFRLGDMNEFIMEPCIQSKKAYMKTARKYNLPENLCEALTHRTTGDRYMDLDFIEGKMPLTDFMMYCQMYIDHCEEYDSEEDRQEFHEDRRMERTRAKCTLVPIGPW